MLTPLQAPDSKPPRQGECIETLVSSAPSQLLEMGAKWSSGRYIYIYWISQNKQVYNIIHHTRPWKCTLSKAHLIKHPDLTLWRKYCDCRRWCGSSCQGCSVHDCVSQLLWQASIQRDWGPTFLVVQVCNCRDYRTESDYVHSVIMVEACMRHDARKYPEGSYSRDGNTCLYLFTGRVRAATVASTETTSINIGPAMCMGTKLLRKVKQCIRKLQYSSFWNIEEGLLPEKPYVLHNIYLFETWQPWPNNASNNPSVCRIN